MIDRSSKSLRWLVAALCVLGLAASPGLARSSVTVKLTTASQDVAQGAFFDVFVDIPNAGSGFNGFSFVVSYDPTAMLFVPGTPVSAQEGCLMNGVCSPSCGQSFHRFSAAGDSLDVTDVLLCNLVSINGPGRLYKLRFHAANRAVMTHIRIRSVNFFDAGIRLPVLNTSDLVLAIGATTGVGHGVTGAFGGLRPEPNPAFGRMRFVAQDDREGWTTAEIMDLQGRVVRRLGPAWLGARGGLDWDRTDSRGMRAPAGVYLVRVQRGGEHSDSRFVLLD
jgi:hypothetical protein